jgi:hypothetical protein
VVDEPAVRDGAAVVDEPEAFVTVFSHRVLSALT